MAKKRYKVQTNPVTGNKEKILKNDYYKDNRTGKIKKIKRFNSKKEEDIRIIKLSIILGIFLLLFLYVKTHIKETIVFGISLILIILLIIFLIPSLRRKVFMKLKFNRFNDNEIKKLITDLKNTDVQKIIDEGDLEKQLYQRLHTLNYNIKRQYLFGSGKKIDLIIDNNVGIELKIADKVKNIEQLIGQITMYNKFLKKLIVVILDVGVIKNLQNYAEIIENIDNKNINVVLLNGDIKRKTNKKYFVLEEKGTEF